MLSKDQMEDPITESLLFSATFHIRTDMPMRKLHRSIRSLLGAVESFSPTFLAEEGPGSALVPSLGSLGPLMFTLVPLCRREPVSEVRREASRTVGSFVSPVRETLGWGK